MKIYHLLFGFICLIMSSCNHKGQVSHDTPFNITGEIRNVEDGYMIILVKRTTGSSTDMIAIDTLINGSFSFSAAAEDNVSYHLVTPHVGVFSSMSVDIYAEPGADIKVKGDGYLIKDWIVESKVKNQKIFQAYQDLVAPMLHQMQEMELEYRRIGKAMEYLRAKDPLDKEVTDITTAWLKDQKKVSAPWLDLMYRYANAAFQLKDKELQKNRVHRLISYFDENYRKKITLSMLAEREEISPTYLSHFFRKKFGVIAIVPVQYFDQFLSLILFPFSAGIKINTFKHEVP